MEADAVKRRYLRPIAAKVSKCFESSLLRLGLPHSRCPQSHKSLAYRLNITLQPRLHLPIQPRPIPLATPTFNLETARPGKDCLQVRTTLPARTAWAPAKSLAVGISRRNTLGTGAAASRLGCNRTPQACAICAFRRNTFRSAVIDGGECPLWVNRVISGAGSDVRFSPESDRIAALRQPTRGAASGQSQSLLTKCAANVSTSSCEEADWHAHITD